MLFRHLQKAHRFNALFLLLFLIAHIINHLFAIAGPEIHIQVMDRLRVVYRNPLVETIILVSLILQIYTGARILLRRKLSVKAPISLLQAVSGLYLVGFLFIHVTAVLFGRFALELDTNFYFAAAGYQAGMWSLFFIPYYFLAVLALFVHLACAVWKYAGGAKAAYTKITFVVFIITGFIFSVIISASLMGKFEQFIVPAQYLATYP